MAARACLAFLSPPLDVVFFEGGVALTPAAGTAEVVFDGPRRFWERAMQAPPPPGYEALSIGRRNGASVTASRPDLLTSYWGVWERIVEILRCVAHGRAMHAQLCPEPFRDTDAAVGRYRYVRANGVEARVYYEEAGEGAIPLLLQATAGGDSRQYRHLLADPQLQKRFRMIAYDLPWHGRSAPPIDAPWWTDKYTITTREMMNWVVAIADALALKKPIFMGCSVGGNLALDLAAHHGDRFRGFVSVNGWHDMAPLAGLDNTRFRHPLISPDYYVSMVLRATGPTAPERFRQEVAWVYASNAWGIYAGDNDCFVGDHDLSKNGASIDAERTPVYLLVGEYDPSAADPEHGGAAVPNRVPGAIYREMKGLSHFAPMDDPLGFREHCIPVLDELVGRTGGYA